MNRRGFFTILFAGAAAATGIGFAKQAVAASPVTVPVEALNEVEVEFTRHTRQHRLAEIRARQRWQRRRMRRGPPPGRDWRRHRHHHLGRGYSRRGW